MYNWCWDATRGQQYYHDSRRNVYQYQDGSQLPGPSFPQPHYQTGPTGPYDQRYVNAAHGRSLSDSSLNFDLSNLTLSPGSPALPPSPHQNFPRPFSSIVTPPASDDQQSRHIRALDTTSRAVKGRPLAQLDHKYKVRPANFFTFGKVLRILWSEPTNIATTDTVITPYGEYTHVKIRWFVVIRPTDEGYSTCLPIQTYGGQGVGKQSLRKCHHGIVYTGKKVPKPTEFERPRGGEAGMLPAIEVKRRSRTEAMDWMSRVNYNKVYTVEHNCKVYEFGDVHASSMDQFRRNFTTVWIGEPGSPHSLFSTASGLSMALRESDEYSREGDDHRDDDSSDDNDDDDSDDDDDETAANQSTSKKLLLLQQAHAQQAHVQEAADAAVNPLLAVKHNGYVAYYVDQLRKSENDSLAEWLLGATREEQAEYMRQSGADI